MLRLTVALRPSARFPVVVASFGSCDPLALPAVGVGQPVKPLPDVRRADARSAQIGGPDCISQCFQVRAHSGEPSPSILARNLLSKDDWRPALIDEPSPMRP